MNTHFYNKIKITLSILGITFATPSVFAQNQYQAQNYSPIPYVAYDMIQLYPSSVDLCTSPKTDGLLFSFEDTIYFCKNGSRSKLGLGGVWTKEK
jgi:hypothetical protein